MIMERNIDFNVLGNEKLLKYGLKYLDINDLRKTLQYKKEEVKGVKKEPFCRKLLEIDKELFIKKILVSIANKENVVFLLHYSKQININQIENQLNKFKENFFTETDTDFLYKIEHFQKLSNTEIVFGFKLFKNVRKKRYNDANTLKKDSVNHRDDISINFNIHTNNKIIVAYSKNKNKVEQSLKYLSFIIFGNNGFINFYNNLRLEHKQKGKKAEENNQEDKIIELEVSKEIPGIKSMILKGENIFDGIKRIKEKYNLDLSKFLSNNKKWKYNELPLIFEDNGKVILKNKYGTDIYSLIDENFNIK